MIEKKMFLLGSDEVGEWVLCSSKPEAFDGQEVVEGIFKGEYRLGSGRLDGWHGWFFDPESCLYLKIVASRSSYQWVDEAGE